jgi:alpha-beta hydrolase superfamily lysophospholipase
MKLAVRVVAMMMCCVLSASAQKGVEGLTDERALGIAREVVAALGAGDAAAAYARFDEEMRKAVALPQLEGVWRSLLSSKGACQGETAWEVRKVREFTSVALTLRFEKGAQTVAVTLRDDGRVAGLHLPPAPVETELETGEQEVTFVSGGNTIYGTLRLPQGGSGRVPAMVLISGSGPTDRDGNSRMLPGRTESHRHLARVLADAGVASLRYDKFGVGKTPLGSHAKDMGSIVFDDYVALALDAREYLAGRPGIDTARIGFAGHSEGALIALVAADRMKEAQPPAALVLAMPGARPYMTLIREQVAGQYAAAVKMGAYKQAQADEGIAEIDRLVARVRRDATVPETISPQFAELFQKQNLKFLQTAHRHDPRALASGLPPALPVLVLCGEKDAQMSCGDARLLVDSFPKEGNVRFARLGNVNHVFKEIEGEPSLPADYVDPAKPFSREAERVLADFVRSALH